MISMAYATVPDTVSAIVGTDEIYDVACSRTVKQDMRIKCERSAHEDSSIYIYIYIYISIYVCIYTRIFVRASRALDFHILLHVPGTCNIVYFVSTNNRGNCIRNLCIGHRDHDTVFSPLLPTSA